MKSMLLKRFTWLPIASLLALAACDDANSSPANDTVGGDVVVVRNACERADGFCTSSFRQSNPPGFSIECGPDHVTAEGESSWLGPGSALMPGSRMNGGCGQGATESGEASFYACCYPAPAAP